MAEAITTVDLYEEMSRYVLAEAGFKTVWLKDWDGYLDVPMGAVLRVTEAVDHTIAWVYVFTPQTVIAPGQAYGELVIAEARCKASKASWYVVSGSTRDCIADTRGVDGLPLVQFVFENDFPQIVTPCATRIELGQV